MNSEVRLLGRVGFTSFIGLEKMYTDELKSRGKFHLCVMKDYFLSSRLSPAGCDFQD